MLRKQLLAAAKISEKKGDVQNAWLMLAEVANSSPPKDPVHLELLALEQRMRDGHDHTRVNQMPRLTL